MEANTAKKLSASEVINNFKNDHSTLDLLKVFLITGATDISKSYELISKWHRNSSNSIDKAKFKHALDMLENIELKRVELTSAIYNVSEPVIDIKAEEDEPEAKTFQMLPKLDETLERVRNLLTKGSFSSDSYKEAMAILNSTVKEGKVVNNNNEPETWDTDKINVFLDSIENENKNQKSDKKETKKIGFKGLSLYIESLVGLDKSEQEIKDSTEKFITGAIITSKGGDTFIKDKEVFEDYWNRALHALLKCAVENKNNSKSTNKTEKAIEDKIESDIKPLLSKLDKDVKETSLAKATKALKEIYTKNGFNINLREAMGKIESIAEKIAPNLLKRRQTTTNNSLPVDKTVKNDSDNKNEKVDIYDDSHNIQESNKELWESVKSYTLLDQLYNKSLELIKENKWKDALSMCILLISSGFIKENESSETVILWENNQIKDWFYNIIMNSKQEDKKVSTNETKKDNTEVKSNTGIVPTANSIETATVNGVEKTSNVKLLKPESAKIWKHNYKSRSIDIPVEHYSSESISFEIIDVTDNKHPDLFITEDNMVNFLFSQRDILVNKRNNVPNARKLVKQKFSEYYDISYGEVKSIVESLTKQADEIRRNTKKDKSNNAKQSNASITESKLDIIFPENGKEGETYYDELKVGNPIFEMKDSKWIQLENGEWIISENEIDHYITVENGIIRSIKKAEEISKEESKEEKDKIEDSTETVIASKEESTIPLENSPTENKNAKSEKNDTPTKSTVGEPSTDSNDDISYDGFEDIIKSHNKLNYDKAVFAKVNSYPDKKEGIKNVFMVIDKLRKDSHYKKSFARNYKNTDTKDLLSGIHKIVENGEKIAKNS